MTSRVNPSAMSRHDVRRQLFRPPTHGQSSRLNPATAASASTASTNGHPNPPQYTDALSAGATASGSSHQGASTASAVGGAFRNYNGSGSGVSHHGGASTAAATLHGIRSSYIPTTKSRSRTVRGRSHQDGVLDEFAAQVTARGSSGEHNTMSGSRWDDLSSAAHLHNLRKKAPPLVPEEPEDVVVRDSNGSYGEALEVPLQMMMILRPEILKEQEEEKRANECEVDYAHKELAKQMPNLLAYVHHALRTKVQSLQNDNWMLEDDMKDRVRRR